MKRSKLGLVVCFGQQPAYCLLTRLRLFWPACLIAMTACAQAPQTLSSVPAFRDTRLLETSLTKGVSTEAEVKRLLGAPTGIGGLHIPIIEERPYEVLFYQDIALTDIKASQGRLDLQMRQQILVVYMREGIFEGFTWFSNAAEATAWVKDSLRGVAR